MADQAPYTASPARRRGRNQPRTVQFGMPGDWLDEKLGPLPAGVTQQQRDRGMTSAGAAAKAIIGDHWERPVLPFIAARQCARYAREGDRRDRLEMLQACGLQPYESKPRTGFQQKPVRNYRRP